MKVLKLQSHQFTKIAKQGISQIRSTAQIEAIRKGDQKTLDALFKDMRYNTHSFGDFLKRYISQKESIDYEGFSDDQLVEYLKNSFKKNGLKNQGSLEYGTSSTLTKTLARCLDKPVTRIDRKTCFLFFFGLRMNRLEASRMLTKEFLQADFDIRNPKEVIYLYCLKHHLTYKEVLEWQKNFELLSHEIIDYLNTFSLSELFEPIISSPKREDEKFTEYLTLLKCLSPHYQTKDNTRNETLFNPVSTRVRTYKTILSTLEHQLSHKRQMLRERRYENICMYEDMGIVPDRLRLKEEEQTLIDNINSKKSKNQRLYHVVDADNLGRCLENINANNIEIPNIIIELLKNDILVIPDITADKMKHRLDNSSYISREDLLVSIFLLCTFDFEGLDAPASDNLIAVYRYRRLVFEEATEQYLTSCGFHKLYLLNPLELFLVSCLLYEDPLKYFLAVSKRSRQIIQEKNNEKKKKKNEQ